MIWTRETMGAYQGVDLTAQNATRECRTCTSVWGSEVLGYWGDLPWQDPGGTCCIAYEINRGGLHEYWHGYYCYDELKVWPVRKD